MKKHLFKKMYYILVRKAKVYEFSAMTPSCSLSSQLSVAGGPLWARACKDMGLPPDLKQGLQHRLSRGKPPASLTLLCSGLQKLYSRKESLRGLGLPSSIQASFTGSRLLCAAIADHSRQTAFYSHLVSTNA